VAPFSRAWVKSAQAWINTLAITLSYVAHAADRPAIAPFNEWEN
jgi:hypothetical protein